MDKKRKKKRTVTFSLILVAAMLSAPSVQAQGMLDLLGEYYDEIDQQANRDGGMMGRGTGTVGVDLTNQGFGGTQGGLDNQGFGGIYGGITNQTFDVPLNSGLLIMLAAGAGYATLRKRKSNR